MPACAQIFCERVADEHVADTFKKPALEWKSHDSWTADSPDIVRELCWLSFEDGPGGPGARAASTCRHV